MTCGSRGNAILSRFLKILHLGVLRPGSTAVCDPSTGRAEVAGTRIHSVLLPGFVVTTEIVLVAPGRSW